MKIFTQWLNKRSRVVDLKTVPGDVLAGHLRTFYGEVRNRSNGLYSPSAMTGIRAAIHRFLMQPPNSRNFNILKGDDFQQANIMFDTMCKKYLQDGNKKPKHKDPIRDSDMVLLEKYFEDHASSPVKLQEYVWFSLCYFFGRRGREKWREMTDSFFKILVDENGVEFLSETETETTKNHQGGHKQADLDYSSNAMYDEKALEAFKLLLNKRCKKNTLLFQTPRPLAAIKDGEWFKNEPLGKNTLGAMMKTISKKAGLSNIYTCHCVRASTITTLFQAGVSVKEICGLTKHRNEKSLDPYISGLSNQQKHRMGAILSNKLKSKVN